MAPSSRSGQRSGPKAERGRAFVTYEFKTRGTMSLTRQETVPCFLIVISLERTRSHVLPIS
jgi:hypothetical protein